jgi:hypothetical protein
MALFRFPGSGSFWDAVGVFDGTQNKNQSELNATTGQLAAQAVSANNGKLLGIGPGGVIQAVELSSWNGGSY